MKNKIILLLIVLLFTMFFYNTSTYAEDKDRVLIIYTADQSNDLTHIRILDTVVSYFTSDITVQSQEESVNLKDFSHVFYVGMEKKDIPRNLIEQMEKFKGKIIFFGNNVEQLEKRFEFVKTGESDTIRSISIPNSTIKTEIEETRRTIQIETHKSQSILAYGDDKKPLIIKDRNSYFVGTTNFHNPVGMVLGQVLYDVFEREPSNLKVKYLRLEDIHPKTNVTKLKEIAKYLKNEKIPYLVTVIPVYTSPVTKEEVHFSDVPELVKVLRFMQENGASLILHGYRHQYRDSETGEGFEYWDVENDRPVYQLKDDEIIIPSSEEERHQLEEFERKYIKETVQNGVEEMIAHKLYPLAFEAPHYSMSQAGYEILSQHFSTYVGQLQITDQSWKSSYTPIKSGKPSFLHGMTLIPETMGYVNKINKNQSNPFEASLTDMKSLGDDVSQYSDTYLAAFYHPYLGLTTLKEVVSMLNSYPNTTWLDLKQYPNEVKVNDVLIKSVDGEVMIDKKLLSSDYEVDLVVKNLLKFLLIFGGLLFSVTLYIVPKFRK
ncbi:DUF2334 domain-containing protein [Paenisporosarcina sp. TG20]|uniref:DUF2334 domain-containing protein n=1 Tax=Paenisporosarcina sp. TG20 TaxID=1211706 RepID=UPI0002FC3F74|nr:DUF2334 domain-containing protein [Paenisporosarcina sp. TG20]